MLDWFSSDSKEKARKAKKEADLKRSLAAKLAQYEEAMNDSPDDHTEVVIDGKKLRVAKEQITLSETSANTTTK